ncbi:MAG: xylulokinase [Candidatus Bathyarchaeia archaeon]
MGGKYFLGIDIGTEGTKVALFDAHGKIVMDHYEEYDLICRQPGWAEQDPIMFWEVAAKSVRRTLKQSKVLPRDVSGVGVCGQMHAAIPIDKNGQVLYRSPSLWCDKRSAPQCERLKKEVGEELFLKRAANPITPAWTATKIMWLKENLPQVYEQTYKFLVPKDYIVFKLTGVPSIDFSEASGTLIFDAFKERWSEELAQQMNVDLDKMPEIYHSHDVVGEVTREASEATGLCVGTPVVSGGGDFLCTLLGAGITNKERAADISGTASLVAFYSERPLADNRVMNLRHVIDGWIPFGIVEGSLLRWFRNEFGHIEVQEALRKGVSAYKIMDIEAELVKSGSEGLIVIPYFLGERVIGLPCSRGIIFGLTMAHKRSHLIRALMEGITLALMRTVEIIEELGVKPTVFRLIGGGAVSPLWRKIKADVYGKPAQVLNMYHGGVLGAAVLAMAGTGMKKDIPKTIDEMVYVKETCETDNENHRTYQKLYEISKKLHDNCQTLFEELNKLNL